MIVKLINSTATNIRVKGHISIKNRLQKIGEVLPSEISRLVNATDNLVNQQFYSGGQDIIIGRTPQISLKIKTSGQIIQKFKDLFNQNIDLFLKGKYFQFLLPFKKIEGLDEELIKEIYEELQDKIEVLRDNAAEEIVILYTMVISVLITKIRELHFNNAVDEIKDRVKTKSRGVSDKDIQNVLNNLYMRNNDNVSILYNLSYLDALASSFNYKKVSRVAKIQKSKYINKIVNLILSSLNN